MEEIGLHPDSRLIVEGVHTLEGGHQACAALLSRARKPTAILCPNDLTALGVMRRSYELEIQIPKNLSVIGFDDIRLVQFSLPPLTTVQMSQSDLASIAFNSLIVSTAHIINLDTDPKEVAQAELRRRGFGCLRF